MFVDEDGDAYDQAAYECLTGELELPFNDDSLADFSMWNTAGNCTGSGSLEGYTITVLSDPFEPSPYWQFDGTIYVIPGYSYEAVQNGLAESISDWYISGSSYAGLFTDANNSTWAVYRTQ